MAGAGQATGTVEVRVEAEDAREPLPLAAEIRRRLGPSPELPQWPPVSIVVLNRDGAAHLRRLLAGLAERTDYPSLELIVVDNASSDDSLDYVRAAEAPFPISILANVHNESFSDACNQGAELASGELLLFLNNDAEPFEPGWLRELVACLRGSPAAAAGPTLIQPAQDGPPHGYLVHQRGLRPRDAGGHLVPAYRDHLADPLGEGLGEDVETIAVAAACLLIERHDFDRVGGFTHGYWYGPEDVDLALKLRERSGPTLCSGRSVLIHPPNSTLKEVPSAQRRAWLRGNRRLFMERWGPRIRREYELDRLDGGGLWAEPAPPGAEPPAVTRSELEALGFCLKAATPEGEADDVAVPLEGVAEALRRRGQRCLVLRGEGVEDLAGLEYDVAVHLRGHCRYAPRPAQLNLLWSIGVAGELSAIECSRYDLVLRLLEADPEELAAGLLGAVQEYVGRRGFATRIGGETGCPPR